MRRSSFQTSFWNSGAGVGDLGGEGEVLAGEIVFQLFPDELERGRFAGENRGVERLAVALDMAFELLAFDEFQHVKLLLVGDGEHRAKRGVDPVHGEGLRRAGLLRRFTKLAGEGFAEAGAGFKSGVELGGDHGITFFDGVERMAQSPGAGVLRETHVEPLLELPARGGGLDAELAQVFFAPATGGVLLDQTEKLVEHDARRIRIVERAAALAGAEAGFQRLVGRAVEGDVLRQRRASRTDRTAEDACGFHAYIDDAVQFRVAAQDVSVERVVGGEPVQHVRLNWRSRWCTLKMDVRAGRGAGKTTWSSDP